MTRRAWLLMLLLAATWGASYLFIAVALDDLSPVLVVWGRVALGALVLVPVALARGALGAVRAHLPWVTFVAVVQVVVPFLLISQGQTAIPSSLAGILVASAPIFTALLAGTMLPGDRLASSGLVGIAVGMLGVVLLFGIDLGGSTDTLVGGALVLLASLGYAVGLLVAKRRLSEVPPVGVATGIMGVSTVVLLPAVPFALPGATPALDTVGAMVALGAGGTGLAFLVFYVLNEDIGPSRASVVAYIAPVFAVLYGVTLLDEAFTLGTALGLGLILLGSYLAADGRTPWRRDAAAVSRSGPSRSSAPAPARAR